MTENVANTVVGARWAAGVSHAAADPLGISLHLNRSRGFPGSVSENEKRKTEQNILMVINYKNMFSNLPLGAEQSFHREVFAKKKSRHTKNLKFNPTRLGFQVKQVVRSWVRIGCSEPTWDHSHDVSLSQGWNWMFLCSAGL